MILGGAYSTFDITVPHEVQMMRRRSYRRANPNSSAMANASFDSKEHPFSAAIFSFVGQTLQEHAALICDVHAAIDEPIAVLSIISWLRGKEMPPTPTEPKESPIFGQPKAPPPTHSDAWQGRRLEPETTFQIFVKAGRIITLDAKPSETVKDIKSKIFDKLGVPQDKQRLTCNRKELTDDSTVHDSCIKQHTTLHLSCRGLGGARDALSPAVSVSVNGSSGATPVTPDPLIDAAGNHDDASGTASSTTPKTPGDENPKGDDNLEGDENRDPNAPAKPKKMYKCRLDNSEWKQHISSLYTALLTKTRTSVAEFVEEDLKREVDTRRLQERWKASDLAKFIKRSLPLHHTEIQDQLTKVFPEQTPKRRRTNISQATFTNDEEALVASLIELLAVNSHAANPDQVKSYLTDLLNGDLLATGLLAQGGIAEKIHPNTIKRIMNRRGLFTDSRAYPLDPARSEQARPVVLHTFIKHLDNLVKLLHGLDPEGCPWTCYADFPASHKFNTDELAPNSTQHRRPVFIPDSIRKHIKRYFQNCREGDGRVDTHFSCAWTSCADGTHCRPALKTQGAPPPFWIYADKSYSNPMDKMTPQQQRQVLSKQTPDDRIEIPTLLLDILCDVEMVNAGNKDLMNPTGSTIRATKKGSMLQQIFFDMVCHFINYLPDGLGKDGKWSIWFLDWHTSRCHPEAIMHAFRNKVLIVLLPSKTSIWGQPNDCGINMALEQCIADVAAVEGILENSNCTLEQSFDVYVKGVNKFLDKEQERLQRTGENVSTSSYAKPGLEPLNYDSVSWKDAILYYGNYAELKKQQLQKDGVEIADISWTVELRDDITPAKLTSDEMKALLSGQWPDDNLDYRLRAHCIGHCMLKRYLQDPNRNKLLPPTSLLRSRKGHPQGREVLPSHRNSDNDFITKCRGDFGQKDSDPSQQCPSWEWHLSQVQARSRQAPTDNDKG